MLLAGALAAGCTPDKTAARSLSAADTHPADYPTVAAVAAMARDVAEGTGGRLHIRQFPGGQLGEEKDTLELTIFGGIDINRVNLAPLASIAPEALVPTLPFMFDSEAHMRRAMAGPPGDAILAALEPHGLIGLGFYDSGARGFYTMGRAIRQPADMAGLKIRVQSSDVFVAMVEALGAAATPISYGEVYQALLQGVIDGAENNWPSYESSRHFEAAGTYAPTGHVIAPEVLVMARHRWNRLSPADQGILRAAARRSQAVMQKLWAAREQAARQRLLAAGVTITDTVDRAAFRARVLPVWDRFLTTPALRQLASSIRAMA